MNYPLTTIDGRDLAPMRLRYILRNPHEGVREVVKVAHYIIDNSGLQDAKSIKYPKRKFIAERDPERIRAYQEQFETPTKAKSHIKRWYKQSGVKGVWNAVNLDFIYDVDTMCGLGIQLPSLVYRVAVAVLNSVDCPIEAPKAYIALQCRYWLVHRAKSLETLI